MSTKKLLADHNGGSGALTFDQMQSLGLIETLARRVPARRLGHGGHDHGMTMTLMFSANCGHADMGLLLA